MPPKSSDTLTTGMKRPRSRLQDEETTDENRAPPTSTPGGGMVSAISKSKRQRLSNVFDQQAMGMGAFSSPTGPAGGGLDPFAASSPVLGLPTTPPVVATPAGVRTSARRSAAKQQAAAKQTPKQTPVATGKKRFIVERPPAKKLVFEETWRSLGPKTATAGKDGKGSENPSPPPAKVLNSEGEEVVEGRLEGQAKQRRGGSKKSRAADDIYEVPDDSEDELKLNGVADHQPVKEKQPEKKKGGRQRKQKETAEAATDPPPPKKRGRPRKADRIAAEKETDSAPAKVSRRQPRSGKKKSADLVEISDSEEEPDDAVDDQLLADLDYEDGKKSQPVGEKQELKGILSPQKKRLGDDGDRLRKTVAFSRSDEEEEEREGRSTEITFEDLPTKKKKQVPRENGVEPESPTVDDEDDEDAAAEDEEVDSEADGSDEDEVCVICSKPDTRKGNQIVFCDGCDKAVHQKCYGIPRLPKGDWFCRECVELGKDKEKKKAVTSSAGGVTATRKEEETMATIEAAPEEKVPDIPNFERHLRSLQRVLVERCTGRRRIKLRGQEEAYAKTCQLVEQTIVAGEGNSMMVIGARGSGKTTLVESIISDMSAQHKNEFHVVRLNGFIHTDDKLALREIWRQLGKEMAVEDELINKTTNNHADTMASLLALLSHPAEIGLTPQDGVTSRSIIFLIDEFDLFATHARQTLLYNLFDIAQARKAPIAVLGLTTRIDVVESLEKRVKSRFSHRYVYLSLPKSLPAYWEICKQGLVVDKEDMEAEGIAQAVEGHTEFSEWWNGKVTALHKTAAFQHHLESHFYSTKSVPAFLTSCILPLSTLSPSSPTLRIPPAPVAPSPSSLTHTLITTEPPDSKLHLLASLSDLDLSMLIAAARLDIVAHTDTVNFAMAYDEYTSLMSRVRVQSASAGLLALGGGSRVWGRGIAGIAWERLVTLGLLVPAAGSLGGGGANAKGAGATLGQSGGGLEGKMWRVDVALEEIPGAVKLGNVLARWCREI
ncbi:origin recognition complex subunit 4 C-terminus-domain-containing protein [Neurospora tetraspora]|uniref:Origin recognition complex subunit 4 n=1 Tax=Neurospora tetraspora TaxID=94610 RepID=A0AAE0J9C0_9PEZI|nr:origin recognition complex subunit 4 C-terminus-domain-containing protein [Neurospora tetraspora]